LASLTLITYQYNTYNDDYYDYLNKLEIKRIEYERDQKLLEIKMDFIERNKPWTWSRSASLNENKSEEASLFNTRYRSKKASFSKQILLFLITISLLGRSGDQYSNSSSNHKCWLSSGATFMFAAAATASARAANTDDENKKKDRIIVTNSQVASTTTSSEKKNPSVLLSQQEARSNPSSFSEILKKAGKIGMGGGVPGFVAGVVQVLSLMWLRTVMNYQCRYGASFLQTLRILYSEGGIPRFYRGLSFALIQAPLARFVATAANDGVETLLASLKITQTWGPGRSTVIASIIVGMWRIILMPIDTCKTVLQVDSVEGFRNLMRKVKAGKIYVLYQGKSGDQILHIMRHFE
jgi:hypothetical protein